VLNSIWWSKSVFVVEIYDFVVEIYDFVTEDGGLSEKTARCDGELSCEIVPVGGFVPVFVAQNCRQKLCVAEFVARNLSPKVVCGGVCGSKFVARSCGV
jgi:hypothetical protein